MFSWTLLTWMAPCTPSAGFFELAGGRCWSSLIRASRRDVQRFPPTERRRITTGLFPILSEEDASILLGDISLRTSPGFIGRCLTTGRHLRLRDLSSWISKSPESRRNGTTLRRIHEGSRIAEPDLIRLHST